MVRFRLVVSIAARIYLSSYVYNQKERRKKTHFYLTYALKKFLRNAFFVLFSSGFFFSLEKLLKCLGQKDEKCMTCKVLKFVKC